MITQTSTTSPFVRTGSPSQLCVVSAWRRYRAAPDDLSRQDELLRTLGPLITRAAKSQARRLRPPEESDDIAQTMRLRIVRKGFLLRNPALRACDAVLPRALEDALATELPGALGRLARWCVPRRPSTWREHLPLDTVEEIPASERHQLWPSEAAAKLDLQACIDAVRQIGSAEGMSLEHLEIYLDCLCDQLDQASAAKRLQCSQAHVSKTLRRLRSKVRDALRPT